MNKGFQWVKRVKATCYQLFRGKHFCLFRQDKKATLYNPQIEMFARFKILKSATYRV